MTHYEFQKNNAKTIHQILPKTGTTKNEIDFCKADHSPSPPTLPTNRCVVRTSRETNGARKISQSFAPSRPKITRAPVVASLALPASPS